MPIAFLLALQASGMVIDWFGKNEQIRLGKMGAQIEQAGINANIQTSRLETEQESLTSMQQLRQNLGTQAAIMAARGTRSGVGSALSMSTESIGNFNADERMRRINQTGNEASLKAGMTMSKLHQNTNEKNIWNEFRSNVINRFPTTEAGYNQYAKGFKQIAQSFGLTKV